MPKRVDANQAEIVAALRGLGASVTDLHEVGHGCPDILCGYRGRVFLIEIKTETGRLTPDEKRWADEWHGGHYYVVRSKEQALDLVTQDENDS